MSEEPYFLKVDIVVGSSREAIDILNRLVKEYTVNTFSSVDTKSKVLRVSIVVKDSKEAVNILSQLKAKYDIESFDLDIYDV